jgi:GAF domain-containing protein
MAEVDGMAEALVALARIVVSEQTLDATLQQIVELACASLECCDMCAVALLESDGPTTAAATSSEARQVDSMQYRFGEGPSLEAYRQQSVQMIKDTDEETRWPDFCRSASSAGVLSILSAPLIVGGGGMGALNIYCQRRNGFTDDDEKSVAAFASLAAVALENARVYWRAKNLADQLSDALETRGVIEQAKGILIAEEGCTADEAFDILLRASQRSHAKLREVASTLVERASEEARRRKRRNG